MRFKDRIDAGRKLAQALDKYKEKHPLIFALPRGGVVLGAEIAESFNAPLDLVIARKIGHPDSPEYAIAAVTEDGSLETNKAEVASVDQAWFKLEVQKEITEAQRRRQQYLKGREPADVKDKIVIIVDDGIATGLTMLAAIKDIKKRGPQKIIVAIPVTPQDSAQILRKYADELVVLEEPKDYMWAVGAYYDNFEQVDDDEVITIMDKFTSK